jgi:hypothetical protein
MLIEIPSKHGVSTVVGYIKGKSAIAMARTHLGKGNNFTGQNFRARGYFVSTVGRDEAPRRKYIPGQEDEDKHQDHLEMFKDSQHPNPPLSGSKSNRFERFTKTSPRLCWGYLMCARHGE